MSDLIPFVLSASLVDFLRRIIRLSICYILAPVLVKLIISMVRKGRFHVIYAILFSFSFWIFVVVDSVGWKGEVLDVARMAVQFVALGWVDAVDGVGVKVD
jgi:hypothetical protein